MLFELHQKNGSIFNDTTTTLFSTTWKWWEGRIWNETKILSQKVRFQLWCYHLKIVDYLGIIKTIGITLRNFLCKDAISSFGIWLVNNDDIDLHILLFKTIGIGQCLSCYLVFRTYVVYSFHAIDFNVYCLCLDKYTNFEWKFFNPRTEKYVGRLSLKVNIPK